VKRIVDDERMMLLVCDLYYNQSLGQKEIAKKLNLSRPTVSRLLINAREKGVVKIILADLSRRAHIELEQKLQKKYSLRDIIITDSHEDKEALHEELGYAGALFLERILKNNDIVGVSMGTTIPHIIPHITADYFQGLTFVPMIGGVGVAATELHSNYLADSFAKAFHGTALAFHAPAMVSRIQAKHELLQEESIAGIISMAGRFDVALSGIGAPNEDSTIIKTGYFSHEMLEDFVKNDICGDICLQFFDTRGNLSRYEHNQRVVGVDIETLRGIPWSIGIAGGVKKAGAIRGALSGRYINALITDEECARRLLDG